MTAAKTEPDHLVRDSFIMPARDHALIAKIARKYRLLLPRDPTKNEILRIALRLLDEAEMANEADQKKLITRFNSLKVPKRGRPSGS
jgi:hypothetical protein